MIIINEKEINTGIGFYSITIEKSGFVYFGSTKNLSNRLSHHLGNLRRNMHPNNKLQKAYNLNKKVIIDYRFTKTREEAYLIEQEEIDKVWGSILVCNACRDVRNNVMSMHTEEVKNKRLKTMNSPEFIKSQSNRTIEQWKDPEKRARLLSNMNSKEAILKRTASLNTPEAKAKAKAYRETLAYKEQQSLRLKELWKDPIYREKTLSNRDSEKVRIANEARRKPLLINGKIYSSAQEASLELKYTPASINRLARDINNLNFKYIERNYNVELD